jgi:hypothetical protein
MNYVKDAEEALKKIGTKVKWSMRYDDAATAKLEGHGDVPEKIEISPLQDARGITLELFRTESSERSFAEIKFHKPLATIKRYATEKDVAEEVEALLRQKGYDVDYR